MHFHPLLLLLALASPSPCNILVLLPFFSSKWLSSNAQFQHLCHSISLLTQSRIYYPTHLAHNGTSCIGVLYYLLSINYTAFIYTAESCFPLIRAGAKAITIFVSGGHDIYSICSLKKKQRQSLAKDSTHTTPQLAMILKTFTMCG